MSAVRRNSRNPIPLPIGERAFLTAPFFVDVGSATKNGPIEMYVAVIKTESPRLTCVRFIRAFRDGRDDLIALKRFESCFLIGCGSSLAIYARHSDGLPIKNVS